MLYVLPTQNKSCLVLSCIVLEIRKTEGSKEGKRQRDRRKVLDQLSLE